jgi:dethiobiotin synthetase
MLGLNDVMRRRRVFITGTDTNVGKTVIASWLALHSGWSYFKPIQTGISEDIDSNTVKNLANIHVYPEIYRYSPPVSPHLAAKIEKKPINMQKIILPEDNLIVEGAGGVMVPLNESEFMIDLIQKFQIPVILVARTTLGTINHSLLSLELLKLRKIPVLGVIMNGQANKDNCDAIANYGKVSILAEFPNLSVVNHDILKKIKLSRELSEIFSISA